MRTAQIFNERESSTILQIYGAMTTGNQWKFLSLEDTTAYIDLKDHYLDRIDDITGILVGMVQPPSAVGAL